MKENYDIVVVGCGTAGMFFAKRMAEQGFSVLAVDALKKEDLAKRLDVFHIDKAYFEKYGIPEPKQGDEDYLGIFEYGITKSAFDNYPKKVDYPFLVMRLPKFMQRLYTYTAGFGVEYEFETRFVDFICGEDGKICGARLQKKSGEAIDVKSRIVVDCSGIPSVARTKLPSTSAVENFEIGPRDMFYVRLRYVKLKNPEADKIERSIGWAYYKSWIAPAINFGEAIYGIGANLSFETAEKWWEKFTSNVKLPEHEVMAIQDGITPYRRPPYSFVDDGFLCLGDAACCTKPYSGEGVSCAWNQCDLAAKILAEALKDGAYPTKEKLWDINKIYNGTQGADFAYILATLSNAVDCSAEENEYEFKHDIVFNTKDMSDMNKTFRVKMSVGGQIKLVFKVLGGVLSGNIKIATVKSLMNGTMIAAKLQKHYKKFPKTPKHYEKWCKKANKLWVKCGSIADCVEKLT